MGRFFGALTYCLSVAVGSGAAVAVSARCHNGQEGRGGCVTEVSQWGRDTAAQLGSRAPGCGQAPVGMEAPGSRQQRAEQGRTGR